jgi:hypothetical protein
MTDSLQASDQAVAAVAKAPRVTLADIEAAIASRYDLNAGDIIRAAVGEPVNEPLRVLSLCLLVMRNGFTIIGKSAPASPENFNADLGRKLAYEDAVRQIWPLMGFALREQASALREERNGAVVHVGELRKNLDEVKERLAFAEAENQRMRGYLERVQEDDVVREELVTVGEPDGEQRMVPKRKPTVFAPQSYCAGGERRISSIDTTFESMAFRDENGRPRRHKHWVIY